MTQPASARADLQPQPQPAPVTPTHTNETYFIAVDDMFELNIARTYLLEHYPHTLGKVVRELPLLRLRKTVTVIPLTRGEDRSASYAQVFEGNSVRGVHVPPKDLIHQVREGKPISIASHWREVRDEFDPFGGELNRDSFLEKLSELATPAVARIHIGSPHVVRLMFV